MYDVIIKLEVWNRSEREGNSNNTIECQDKLSQAKRLLHEEYENIETEIQKQISST